MPANFVASAHLAPSSSWPTSEPDHNWDLTLNLTTAGAAALDALATACDRAQPVCPGTMGIGKRVEGVYLVTYAGRIYTLPIPPDQMFGSQQNSQRIEVGDLTKGEAEQMAAAAIR